MNRHSVTSYCSGCGKPLETVREKVEGGELHRCSSCGYVVFSFFIERQLAEATKEKAQKWDYWAVTDPTSVAWLCEYRDMEEKLEAIATKVGEWDKVHYRDKHAAPSILEDLEKILEAEE